MTLWQTMGLGAIIYSYRHNKFGKVTSVYPGYYNRVRGTMARVKYDDGFVANDSISEMRFATDEEKAVRVAKLALGLNTRR